LPTAGLLYSTEYYKELKGEIVGFKPVFVAGMWTFSAVLLPCILHDHDYSIIGDISDYLPCFLVLFACTNLADVKDIDEDIVNGVNTLPVVFGKENTQMLVMACLFLSSLMFGFHPNYIDRPLINGAFELQNAFLSFITLLI
jgi:4-hydroxybenzoate polyprenyltransferase